MSTIGMDAILNTQPSFNTTGSNKRAESLGKDDFLNLLIKQMQYQDPLNPVENADFTAQLAQFTSLETLSNIDENIVDLGVLQSSINNITAVSFIGKKKSGKTTVVHELGLAFEGQAENMDRLIDSLTKLTEGADPEDLRVLGF